MGCKKKKNCKGRQGRRCLKRLTGQKNPKTRAQVLKAFNWTKESGYCMYENERKSVNIKCVVVADMSFQHKYLQRGGGSASTTCFCFMCSSNRYYRHKGYPGGCRKCRRTNKVYDKETGVQTCLHHDVCTPEFLLWETARYEDLIKKGQH